MAAAGVGPRVGFWGGRRVDEEPGETRAWEGRKDTRALLSGLGTRWATKRSRSNALQSRVVRPGIFGCIST